VDLIAVTPIRYEHDTELIESAGATLTGDNLAPILARGFLIVRRGIRGHGDHNVVIMLDDQAQTNGHARYYLAHIEGVIE
jgi:hypothetical protein